MKATLAMALHFHQPVGNFDDVINRACDKCYIPFLKMLRSYPSVKMTLHFTGCLLEWAEKNRPEMLETIKGLAASGQVEIMTGGFDEPILISIPPEDRIGQIKMLTEYVKKNFSFEPSGAWVAERVWEQTLAGTFSDAGVRYVILDDTHFLYAGVPKNDTYGYHVTEDNGKTVAIFASDKGLRYHLPFKMPAECMEYIRGVAEKRKDPLLVYGDDGEKFGEWPGTHKWVFEEKWLKNFFDELVNNSEWLRTSKLSDCLKERVPLGRTYLPTSSYEEMLEWSLPADSQEYMEDVIEDIKRSGKEEYYKPFIRGGFWRNFLTKYPESNQMNKKMLRVSGKLSGLRKGTKHREMVLEAEKELFRGQCNCSYWHGVFGGLYLYHLRNAVYSHLIRAEAIIDRITFGKKEYCRAEVVDHDADGRDEAVIENRDVSAVVSPYEGAVIKEFDSKACCQNFINSLSRKKEAYHRKILKKIAEQSGMRSDAVKTIHDGIDSADPSLKDHMVYDRYGRYSFMDHFLGADISLRDMASCRYEEKGDLIKAEYSCDVSKNAERIELRMTGSGMVSGTDVTIKKTIRLPKKGAMIQVLYLIKNEGKSVIKDVFSPEINVTMPFADSPSYEISFDPDRKKYGLGEKIDVSGIKKMEIKDRESKSSPSVSLVFEDKCGIWHFPVKTVSQSEKAYELNYQSSAVIARYPLMLEPGKTTSIGIEFRIDAKRSHMP